MDNTKAKRRNRGPRSSSLRYSGWRPPLVSSEIALLVSAIGDRAELSGQSARAILEAALLAYATAEEKAKAGIEKPNLRT